MYLLSHVYASESTLAHQLVVEQRKVISALAPFGEMNFWQQICWPDHQVEQQVCSTLHEVKKCTKKTQLFDRHSRRCLLTFCPSLASLSSVIYW